MREIKFRAWNKDKKIMVYEDEDNGAGWLDGWRANDVQVLNQTLNSPFEAKIYEFMQYTGLKDKNGKEIYEGDIVKAYFKKGAWKWNDKDYYGYKNGKIEYCVDCYILYIENYKEKIYPLSSFGNNNKNIQDLEVIGNIYDNPELLKEG